MEHYLLFIGSLVYQDIVQSNSVEGQLKSLKFLIACVNNGVNLNESDKNN